MTHAHVSLRTVLGTGAAVLLLWAASWGVSYLPLGVASLPVALAIAAAKAVLVALFFMEVVRATLSIKLTLLVACTLTLTLAAFMVADIATRATPVMLPPP